MRASGCWVVAFVAVAATPCREARGEVSPEVGGFHSAFAVLALSYDAVRVRLHEREGAHHAHGVFHNPIGGLQFLDQFERVFQ